MSILVPEKIQSPKQLWWRIGSLLMLVLAMVLILISFLNYSNYRKNYLELNLTRYLIMAKDLRQTIESGLNIGISPAENTHLRPIMQELATTQAATRYISIIDDAGMVIKQGNLPARPDDYWRKQLAHTTSEGYWQASNADTFEIGMPYSNNFNLPVGTIVIGYDRPAIESAMQEMLRKLILDLVQALLLCAIIVFGGCYWLTRKLARELVQVSNNIENKTINPEPLSTSILGEDVTAGINEFAVQSHLVANELAQIERAMQAGRQGETS